MRSATATNIGFARGKLSDKCVSTSTAKLASPILYAPRQIEKVGAIGTQCVKFADRSVESGSRQTNECDHVQLGMGCNRYKRESTCRNVATLTNTCKQAVAVRIRCGVEAYRYVVLPPQTNLDSSYSGDEACKLD